MQQQFRMRKNGHFQRVYKKGKPAAARELTLLYLKGPRLLVGFSVSKKVGGAVTRNKIKRRLRAAFREELPKLRPGLYVIAVVATVLALVGLEVLGRLNRYLRTRSSEDQDELAGCAP